MSERIDADALVAHFRRISDERMQGLPIVNPRLDVEAVGFRDFDEHRLGILITPWFMNLVLLPGNDDWSELKQGDKVEVSLPSEAFEFTVCCDDALPDRYLSAILFRTVSDFSDQAMASEIAREIAERIFVPREREADDSPPPKPVSRRALLSGEGFDEGFGKDLSKGLG
jgi:[NiFe] hydrogenase assembly HybE family chaperone